MKKNDHCRPNGTKTFVLFFSLCAGIQLICIPPLFSTSNVRSKLTTTDGSTSFDVNNANDNTVASIDSSGSAIFISSVGVRGPGLTVSAILSTGTAEFQRQVIVQGSATVKGAGLTTSALLSTGAATFQSSVTVQGNLYPGNQTVRYIADEPGNNRLNISTALMTGNLQIQGYIYPGVPNASQGTRFISDSAANGRTEFSSSAYIAGNLYGQSTSRLYMPVVVSSHAYVNVWWDAADNTTFTDEAQVTLTVPFAPAVIFGYASIASNNGNGAANIQFDTKLVINGTDVAFARSQDSISTDNKNMTNSMFGLLRVASAGDYVVKIQYLISSNVGTTHWNGPRTVGAYALPSQ